MSKAACHDVMMRKKLGTVKSGFGSAHFQNLKLQT